MRQAIGSTWVMQLVIVFMLIFVAFLALSINYTKAFKVKNELVTIIEKYEGVKDGSSGSLQIINNYLKSSNYSVTNKCAEGEYGMRSLDSPSLEQVRENSNTKYFYCISKINTKANNLPNRSKYEIKIFFKFNLPVLGDVFTFTASGTTIDINYPSDNLQPMP